MDYERVRLETDEQGVFGNNIGKSWRRLDAGDRQVNPGANEEVEITGGEQSYSNKVGGREGSVGSQLGQLDGRRCRVQAVGTQEEEGWS